MSKEARRFYTQRQYEIVLNRQLELKRDITTELVKRDTTAIERQVEKARISTTGRVGVMPTCEGFMKRPLHIMLTTDVDPFCSVFLTRPEGKTLGRPYSDERSNFGRPFCTPGQLAEEYDSLRLDLGELPEENTLFGLAGNIWQELGGLSLGNPQGRPKIWPDAQRLAGVCLTAFNDERTRPVESVSETPKQTTLVY